MVCGAGEVPGREERGPAGEEVTVPSRGTRTGFRSALGLLGPPTKGAVRAAVCRTELSLCRGVRR